MQERQGITAREIARRAEIIAGALKRPGLAFTHRAVSGWLNGTRNPSLEHRRLLAVIFGVSFEELNHGCDDRFDEQEAAAALNPVTVRVFGKERTFEYRMTLRAGINLDYPAVYQHWADMFSPWPASLVRHLARAKANLYGWVPGLARSPSLQAAGSLVALDAERPRLDPAGTVDPHTWFIYLPRERLVVGKAVRESRSVLLMGPPGTAAFESYPLSRVDLVGRISGKSLLEIPGNGK